MGIKKILTTIVLAGALALSGAGCRKDYPQYHYNGKIGEDNITFFELRTDYGLAGQNILIVKKSDGRIISYIDKLKEDLKLESVDIAKGSKRISYTAKDKVGKQILEEAQKQFDSYLKQIIDLKLNQGLENLK